MSGGRFREREGNGPEAACCRAGLDKLGTGLDKQRRFFATFRRASVNG